MDESPDPGDVLSADKVDKHSRSIVWMEFQTRILRALHEKRVTSIEFHADGSIRNIVFRNGHAMQPSATEAPVDTKLIKLDDVLDVLRDHHVIPGTPGCSYVQSAHELLEAIVNIPEVVATTDLTGEQS